MKQYNLFVRSAYTFFESLLSIDEIVNFAIKNKMKQACLIDKNVMYGAYEFYTLCKKNNINPIIGIEVEKLNKVFIAKNLEGYKELLKISSSYMTDDGVKVDLKNPNLISINAPTKFISLKEKKDFELLEKISKANNKILDKNSCLNLVEESEASKHYSESELKNIEKIISSVNLEISVIPIKLKKFENPKNIDSKKYLQELVIKRLSGLKLNHDQLKIYEERIKKELDVITSKNFENYFLIVYDFVKWAKEKKIIIGPGRGSAPGSLVSYLLDITTIDPIQTNLYFERFLNSERINFPDIDIDIEDTRREELINYFFSKYGKDYVAQIITFQTLKGRSSIRDAGRMLEVPLKEVDFLSKNTSEFDGLEEWYKKSKEYKKLIDSNIVLKKVWEVAKKIEGLPRQYSTHAAGMVLSEKKLFEYVPIQKGHNELYQTQYSMDYLEPNGLIKIDLLGLRNLSFIKEVLLSIKNEHGKDIDLTKIDMADEKVYRLLREGHTAGIFQLESPGMTSLLGKLKVDCFSDIVAATSLFRPGPQKNIPMFIERKFKLNKTKLLDEKMEELLKETYGVLVYQEQVMLLAKEYANFRLEKADDLRRAISKKDFSILETLKSEFIEGCLKNSYSEKFAIELWKLIESFGNYGFNKSHAYAYTIISYQLAYLKTYYKECFMTSLLNSTIGSFEKTSSYIDEAKKMKIEIVYPDINISEKYFSFKDNKIYFGFAALKGIGIKAAEELVEERTKNGDYKNFIDFIARIENLKVNSTVVDNLIKSNAFSKWENIETLLTSRETINEYLKHIKVKDKKGNTKYDFTIATPPKLKKVENKEESSYQSDSFGFVLDSKTKTVTNYYQDQALIKKGKIISLRKLKTKVGTDMAFGNFVDDQNEKLSLVFWPGVYKKYADKIQINNNVTIEGKIDLKKGTQFIVSTIDSVK